MPDRVDSKTRSRIMSSIRSKNTKVEMEFVEGLLSEGIDGFECHKKMLGNPDIVFEGERLAIFIDGDFWHGYNWISKGKLPPQGYWQEKITKNMERDRLVTSQLESEGWKVMRFWEHEVKADLSKCIITVTEAIRNRH